MTLVAQQLISDTQIDEFQDLARLFELDRLGLDTSPMSVNYPHILEIVCHSLPVGRYP